MDLELFSALLRNLLHTEIRRPHDEENALANFERKYCYNAVLQPMFTQPALARLLSGMGEHIFYEIRDELGVCLLFFLFDGKPFLAGPFVREEFDAARTERVLVRHRMSASYAPSVKLYRSAFPLLSSTFARRSVQACAYAFSEASEEYSYCRLDNGQETPSLPVPRYTDAFDYTSLYRRYDLENRFLHMIELGDTENVLGAFRDMSMLGVTENRYISAIYQDPNIGLGMVRALARKAAERGGASLVEIHDITQRAMQEGLTARSREAQAEISAKMVLSLTEAVRRHRLNEGNYTPPIQKVIEYLRLNFSQEVSLARLAEHAGFSESYLSKQFKKEVGITVSQFIANLRVMQAAEMLRHDNLPIQEISGYVGYPDSNYFVKVFKRHYGVTPSDYRAGRERAVNLL